MTLNVGTASTKVLSKASLGIMTLSKTTLSKLKLILMILNIMILNRTTLRIETQHNNAQNSIKSDPLYQKCYASVAI
jgi:hypothetical protein